MHNINIRAGINQDAVSKDKTIVDIGEAETKSLQCGALAAKADQSYKQLLQEFSQRHLNAIKSLLPITTQSSVLSQVMQQCNDIEDVCNGVFLKRIIRQNKR